MLSNIYQVKIFRGIDGHEHWKYHWKWKVLLDRNLHHLQSCFYKKS